jgi:hypothetical protein
MGYSRTDCNCLWWAANSWLFGNEIGKSAFGDKPLKLFFFIIWGFELLQVTYQCKNTTISIYLYFYDPLNYSLFFCNSRQISLITWTELQTTNLRVPAASISHYMLTQALIYSQHTHYAAKPYELAGVPLNSPLVSHAWKCKLEAIRSPPGYPESSHPLRCNLSIHINIQSEHLTSPSL